GWSSPVARQAHNLKAAGSNPAPATKPSHKNNTQKPASCGLFAFKKVEELILHQGAATRPSENE
ncbi:hypothetical protein ACCS54_35560, partial [Rhizobium johnstonii]|uniref:hypothetical protein n=1 Tax=Rhizobium johnstonii TaxID=3019933 RepID=UPI003F9CDDFB